MLQVEVTVKYDDVESVHILDEDDISDIEWAGGDCDAFFDSLGNDEERFDERVNDCIDGIVRDETDEDWEHDYTYSWRLLDGATIEEFAKFDIARQEG